MKELYAILIGCIGFFTCENKAYRLCKGDFCLRMREKLFYFYPFVNALREALFSVLLNLTTEPLKENHCLIGPQ